jgi:hypothetical protein
MAKKKGGSPCGLTPVLPDTVWLFQVNPRDDSFVAAAASANFIHIRLCWSYVFSFIMLQEFYSLHLIFIKTTAKHLCCKSLANLTLLFLCDL